MRTRAGIPERRGGNYGPIPPRVLRAVIEAGCEPVPLSGRGPTPAFDVLLLTGGATPQAPGFPAPTGNLGFDNERDDREYSHLEAALLLGVPIVGVCRGMQLLALWAGGTLCEVDPTVHFGSATHRDPVHHSVDIVAGSPLASITQAASVPACSSRHRYGVQVGDGVEVVATSADGTAEGIVLAGHPACGVLWHPEDSPPEALARRPLNLLRLSAWL